MSNYGTLLLNKVIEENDVQALIRYKVKETDFTAETDKKVFRFIREHAKHNEGQAPSYSVVVTEIPEFFYVPGVEDKFPFLVRELFNERAAHDFTKVIRGLQEEFQEGQRNMSDLIDRLTSQLTDIKMGTGVLDKVGTSVKTDTDLYMKEYELRKAGESFKTWKSKFSVINEYISGNLYVFFGKSGRGKSVITLEDALYAAMQGATVLIWAMEMPIFEVLTRAYVSLSGEEGITRIKAAGIDMSAGFDAAMLKKATLDELMESAFREFISSLNDKMPGNIIVRAVDDEDFHDRSLKALEADIIATEADIVVIDPFYYLDYEKNTSKTTGGDAAETSKKLRALAGRRKVVAMAITQADEGAENEDDSGNREIELPKRKDVAKTKQLLQDASLLIAIDTDYKQSRGLVGIDKGRDGGEGDFCEILYMPQYGVVRQMQLANAGNEFNF